MSDWVARVGLERGKRHLFPVINPTQLKEKKMKKMNVILMLLLALSLAMPATFTFAASKSSGEQVQTAVEKININTADMEALVQVPGIGPKTAEKIVQHRQENGNFTSLDDLAAVKGIGEKSLKKMKPYLVL